MKKIKLFISFFIILIISFLFFYNLKLQKSYNYITNTTNLKTNFKEDFKEEAALNVDLSPVKWTWIDSNIINSNTDFDTIYFKIPKKAEFETYAYKAKLKIIIWDKTYYPEIDWDWDDRLLTDDTIHFSPIFLNSPIKSFSYILSFSDKSLLVDQVLVTTLDTKSYSYNLALETIDTEADEIWIIKRSDWGAIEDYRYTDSKYWKAYYDKLASSTWTVITAAQQAQIDKLAKINNYLNTSFPEDSKVLETIKTENWHPLVRPIQKTEFVKAIIIHHTDTQDISKASDEILRGIYYYHSMSNWRWDVGYNYIVGQDGKIYEWKAGWDYAVGSHTLRNNKSNVSISVIWNYQTNTLNEVQQVSINKLVWYLAKKYWIDLDKERVYHKSCLNDTKCVNPLVDYTGASLIWHRDAGYTACPWDNIYSDLANFKESNIDLSSWNKFVSNLASMKIYEENKIKLASNVGVDLGSTRNINSAQISEGQTQDTAPTGFDKNNIIKVKLSYPETQNTISLKYWDKIYDLEMSEWKLYNNWALISDKLQIWTGTWIVEIISWSRVPSWDTAKKYNDNKFRWIITLYAKNWKLVVVNELFINDYMKWIAEISNDALEQKAKTILVSARSYARWYISKDNRKFPWEYYDGSDDPNVFQKYLWYSMEQRNTNIVKLVEATQDEVITYDGKLIKPWYFNQSNGKTLSYFEYCLKNNPEKTEYCKSSQSANYPYLIWVSDPSWSWKTTLGHWVGLSWDWATYFAKLWWDYKKIIKYYYTWVYVVKAVGNDYYRSLEVVENIVKTSTGNTMNTNISPIQETKTSTWIVKIFSDVDSSNKYYPAIKYFKDKNTISWFSDGSFRPLNKITRIESLKIILTSFGYTKIDNKTSIFTDVATKTWENAYIQKAILLSIVDTKNKTFSPSRNINRVEALKLIMILKKIDINSYKTKNYYIKDVSKTDWFYPYVVYALENKLFALNSWYFYPTQAISRGELIDIMYKLK